MPPTRRRRTFSSGGRRNRLWVMSQSVSPAGNGFASGTGGNFGTAQALDILALGEAEIGHNFYDITVTRIRGYVSFRPSSLSQNNEWLIAAGICFLPDTAMTAGDMPNPGTDNYDWIWHQQTHLFVRGELTPAAPLWMDQPPQALMMVDNKSQRKQRENSQNLVLVVSSMATTASTPIIHFGLRTLVLMP